MATAVARRRFSPEKGDAQRFVFLVDPKTHRLFEVVGIREISGAAPSVVCGPKAAIKLLDVSKNLPDDAFEALDAATWVGVKDAMSLEVVVPISQDVRT